MSYEDWEDFPLYHGIRTNKTIDQIKKEGICTFRTVVDWKKEIMLALKYFGKEKLATTSTTTTRGKGYLIRDVLREVKGRCRGDIWATSDKDAACRWWAQANPESISLLLLQIGIEPNKIDKYLSERYGKNCYNIKLKMTSLGETTNFSTGLKCIPSNLIDSIERCEDCGYTGKEHKKILKN